MPDADALFAAPIGALLIFCLRIVDVSCDTMRVLFAIRGRRLVAGALGFAQALIWIFAVGQAVKHLDSWPHILGYSAGYASGTMVGITIERFVAYGLATVRIVSRHGGVEIAHDLRERGFGVTEFGGYGRDGTVEFLHSVVQRAHVPEVMKVVDRWDPEAFVTVEEPQILRGGSFAERGRWLGAGRRTSGSSEQEVGNRK
jgi:uncharacterized protein YebE (UPF0316 family)